MSKDALIEAAWPGQAVEDSNLSVQIAALRRALGEAPGGDRWIETMAHRGYRFVGPVVLEGQAFIVATPSELDAPREALPIGDGEAERRQITALARELVGARAGAGGTGLEDLRKAVGAFKQSLRPFWRGRVIVSMAATASLVIVCLVWWLWPASNFFYRAGEPAEQATGSTMSTTTTPNSAAISALLVAPRLSSRDLPAACLDVGPVPEEPAALCESGPLVDGRQTGVVDATKDLVDARSRGILSAAASSIG